MPRSRIEELRQLRLDLLEVPWDPKGREIVLAEMERLGLSSDRLYVRLVNAGWEQSYSTLGRWLRGQSEPSATELGLLTEVLLNYPDNWPNWPKARNLSSPQEAYSFWPTPRADEDIRLPIPA